jgi:hypothetical protein
MVRILGSHPSDPGSSPGNGSSRVTKDYIFLKIFCKIQLNTSQLPTGNDLCHLKALSKAEAYHFLQAHKFVIRIPYGSGNVDYKDHASSLYHHPQAILTMPSVNQTETDLSCTENLDFKNKHRIGHDSPRWKTSCSIRVVKRIISVHILSK